MRVFRSPQQQQPDFWSADPLRSAVAANEPAPPLPILGTVEQPMPDEQAWEDTEIDVRRLVL